MINYGQAIREGFAFLLRNYPETFTIGQGLWSPWYVGNSMTDLDREFGQGRVIDTPVSELATTGAAVGAALSGKRPIVIHPRVDFFLLAVDQLVNQAAKWRHMFGGDVDVPVVVRAIINRGGEQGAQHSQALHSWFAHIPGLRVVMPSTPADARDLLVAASLGKDPVLYIDDRWLYDLKSDLPPVNPGLRLTEVRPRIDVKGSDITLVACSYSAQLCREAAEELKKHSVSAEVVDLRVINPLDCAVVIDSVRKTGRLLAVDGDWTTCGLAGEVIASVVERLPLTALKAPPRRLTLPDAPAPTSRPLEKAYYFQAADVTAAALTLLRNETRV
jgi:acetoin:2,6-dichlorophenolindophenol oxidoreductase subunit beta